MNRPFAVFDIDGTIIRWQLYHAIVTQLASEGKLSKVAVEAIDATRQTWRKRAHTESFGIYELAVVDGYHDALKNLSSADFYDVVDTVFDTYKDQVYTYTRDLIKELKSKGYLLFAVSGSHQEVVEKLGVYYGFDAVVGAQYHTTEGRFTGERTSPIESGKASIVQRLVDEYDASWEGSLAIGDSLSDAAVLQLVEQPIAFNPNKQLFAKAQQHGWKVVVERKNMIYHLIAHDQTYQLEPMEDANATQ